MSKEPHLTPPTKGFSYVIKKDVNDLLVFYIKIIKQ